MTTNWKYVDASNQSVMRTLDSGVFESCLVSVIDDWIAEGNTPDPADPVVIPIPQSVTPLQARRALLAANLLDAVTSAVANETQEIKLAWEFAGSVERNSEFTRALATVLGLSDAQVDDLFISAATFV